MRKVILGCVVLLALGAGAVLLFGEQLYTMSIKPSGAFADSPPPAAPDYSRPEAWAALPDTLDDADVLPAGVDAPSEPTADVFFIHPTTHLRGTAWNAGLEPADNNSALMMQGVLRYQASAFSGCCRVFAPRYRQAHLYVFMALGPDAHAALDLAYHDVEAAFDEFIKRSAGRPFIVAGHSQGTLHAFRLLAQRVIGTPLQQHLVAAYLVGYRIPAWLRSSSLSACAQPSDTGCFVGWRTVAEGAPAGTGAGLSWSQANGYGPGSAEDGACINPLSWDQPGATAEQNTGALDFGGPGTEGLPPLQEHVTGAKCAGALLEVHPPAKGFSDFTMGQDYHFYDYNLFWMSIRHNAEVRAASFATAQATDQPSSPQP